MSTITEQIKERVDIVDLISGYLKLQKSGVNYKAHCPFHNEKSGSFFVSPERQIWHCFGCGLGGDVFGFVKQIDGVEFPEALRILANKAGVQLTRVTPEFEVYQSAKNRLYDVCELAARFFEKQLWNSGSGKKALEYLRKRGLTDESIKSFRLGFAPDSWNSLGDFLSRGFSDNEIFNAGLAVKKESGSFYDRFRSRIMFPIFDLNGQVVGFSGRVFSATPEAMKEQESSAKYVNTPQTQIYDKSRVLYGLDRAKIEIRRKGKCLVVEGNADVVMSHQAGVGHAVASSGTALTDGHLKIIKRYTDNLDLCFDADSAGTIATDRGVDLALARGFNVGIISIDEPDLKDPADYVAKHGSKWSEYTQKSRPFMEFYFSAAQKTFDITTALGKKLMTQKILPFLAALSNKIEQAHWVGEIALALKLKEEILYKEIAAVKKPELTVGEITESAPAQMPDSLDLSEESLLALIVKKPELAETLKPEDYGYLSEQFHKMSEQIRCSSAEIVRPLVTVPSGTGSRPDNIGGEAASLVAAVEPALVMNLEFVYLKAQEFWKDIEEKDLPIEFGKLLNQIKRRKISAKFENLVYEIRAAEKIGNKVELTSLLAKFSEISQELKKAG